VKDGNTIIRKCMSINFGMSFVFLTAEKL